jgi:hypothetical protein
MQDRLYVLRRLLLYATLALFTLAVLLAAVIQIQERILRYRAQRLLSDILSIELRYTTFEQVGDLAAKWNGFAGHEVPCSKEHCDFSIELHIPFTSSNARLYWNIAKFYWLLGGRPAGVLASINVRNGFVWGERYTMAVAPPPSTYVGSYKLMGELSTVPPTEVARDVWPPLRRHAEYEIGSPGGCLNCEMIWAHFSPYTDPADIRRISQFNFSCFTALRSCRTKEDIMPVAVKEISEEGYSRACDPPIVQILSREADDASVAEILDNRPALANDPDSGQILRVRLVERIKRSNFWEIGAAASLRAAGRDATGPVSDLTKLRPGARVIVLISGRSQSGVVPEIGAEACGVMLYTDANLALARKGAALDDRVPPLIEYSQQYRPHKFSEPPGPPAPPPPPPLVH